MDDFFQVLVFVVSIIIFIVGAIRKQNKKSEQAPVDSDFSFEELFGIPQPVAAPVKPIKAEAEFDEIFSAPVVKKPEPVFVEGEKAIKPTPKTTPVIKVDEPSKPVVQVDWQKAIIFSEILKRPEY